MTSRIHKMLSSAVVGVGLTIGILGRLRVLPLLPLGRWFFLVVAVAAGVEFFWTVLARSMTRDQRGGRRFILLLMSLGAMVGASDHGSIHWGWWLTTLAILWIPQLVPTNRYLLLESRYDKRGPQWRDTLLMAIPVAIVIAGFGVWGHYEHRVYVTEHAHCPHGLYKLVYPDHTYVCIDNKVH